VDEVDDRAFGTTRDEDKVHRVPRQAVEGKVSMTRPVLALKRGRQDVQLLFCAHAERPTLS